MLCQLEVIPFRSSLQGSLFSAVREDLVFTVKRIFPSLLSYVLLNSVSLLQLVITETIKRLNVLTLSSSIE